MSAGMNPIQILELDQPAVALAKNLTIHLGWRPAMVWVVNYKAAGRMAVAIDYASLHTVEGGLEFGRNAAMAEVGTDGITFHDNGFKLGQDAGLVTENGANIICVAFRSLNPVAQFDLSDIPATPDGLRQPAASSRGTRTAPTRCPRSRSRRTRKRPMPGLQTKKVEDATAVELYEFLLLNGVEVRPYQKSRKADLVEFHKLSNLPDPIYVAEIAADAAEPASSDLTDLFSQPFNAERERWCRVRLLADKYGEDKQSVQTVIHKSDIIHLPRGRDIVIRERFLRVINDAKEIRYDQAVADGTGKFSEAIAVEEERVPLSFLGTLGRVSEGMPQNVPEGVIVIH